MDAWYRDNLVCPIDHGALRLHEDELHCDQGHSYLVIDGVPVMLVGGQSTTIGLAAESLRVAQEWRPEIQPADRWFLNTLGIVEEEKQGVLRLAASGNTTVDPVVSYLVGATNGIAYKKLIGKLTEYPIPNLRLPPGEEKYLLDLGCSWGRWCLAAARLGYRPIGIDPSLGAIMAARRVAQQQGLDVKYVVGDARLLPFRAASVDSVFSYSVIQHFSREDAAEAVTAAARVLRPGGTCHVQMPTLWGLRCLYQQFRRRFREPTGFEVRYWSIPQLKRLFSSVVGPSNISVDCFFGIGLQPADLKLMPTTHQIAIVLSEMLRLSSRVVYPITFLADSVYVHSVRDSAATARGGIDR